MFTPFGWSEREMTSAPSSMRMRGAILYAAPLAESTTTRRPEQSMPRGIEDFTNSLYLPMASSMRYALPISAAVGRMASISPENITVSIFASISSGSLNPSRPKNLMPLSSYELWDADMTTPASARRLLVRNAIPGVGHGPTKNTSTPMEQMPEVRALSII